MATLQPPQAAPTDPLAEVARLWLDLSDAAEAGDVQAAVFLKTFEPWALQQMQEKIGTSRVVKPSAGRSGAGSDDAVRRPR